MLLRRIRINPECNKMWAIVVPTAVNPTMGRFRHVDFRDYCGLQQTDLRHASVWLGRSRNGTLAAPLPLPQLVLKAASEVSFCMGLALLCWVPKPRE